MTARARRSIREGDDLDAGLGRPRHPSAILEAFVPFEREISVIAARAADGQVECFDVTENEHRDHILKISRAPAAIPEALAAQARGIAETIASALDYVGVLAVEMFVVPRQRRADACWSTRSRRGCTIPAIGRSTAPRSRSSSSISAPLPAGRSASRSATAQVTMTNLIGDDILDYERWLTDARRHGASLRQGPAAAGPQDGPRHEVFPREK